MQYHDFKFEIAHIWMFILLILGRLENRLFFVFATFCDEKMRWKRIVLRILKFDKWHLECS